MSDVKLIRYDAACKAIADAKRVDEVKQIRDVSIAMRAYARQADNRDLEADAIEIRMRRPGQGGGDNLHGGKRGGGGGDGGSGRLCPRCRYYTVGRLPFFFREDGEPICVICGTD